MAQPSEPSRKVRRETRRPAAARRETAAASPRSEMPVEPKPERPGEPPAVELEEPQRHVQVAASAHPKGEHAPAEDVRPEGPAESHATDPAKNRSTPAAPHLDVPDGAPSAASAPVDDPAVPLAPQPLAGERSARAEVARPGATPEGGDPAPARVLGVGTLPGGEAAPNVAAVWRDEVLDLLREEVEQGLAAGRALAQCRSPQAALSVQADYLGRALARGTERGHRLMRLWAATASHGVGAFRSL